MTIWKQIGNADASALSSRRGKNRGRIGRPLVDFRQAGPRIPSFAIVSLPGYFAAIPAGAAAPSVPMLDSFFPSWLICLLVAVVAAALLRVVFVVIGLDDILQARVPVYMSLALGLTFVFSYIFFGR